MEDHHDNQHQYDYNNNTMANLIAAASGRQSFPQIHPPQQYDDPQRVHSPQHPHPRPHQQQQQQDWNGNRRVSMEDPSTFLFEQQRNHQFQSYQLQQQQLQHQRQQRQQYSPPQPQYNYQQQHPGPQQQGMNPTMLTMGELLNQHSICHQHLQTVPDNSAPSPQQQHQQHQYAMLQQQQQSMYTPHLHQQGAQLQHHQQHYIRPSPILSASSAMESSHSLDRLVAPDLSHSNNEQDSSPSSATSNSFASQRTIFDNNTSGLIGQAVAHLTSNSSSHRPIPLVNPRPAQPLQNQAVTPRQTTMPRKRKFETDKIGLEEKKDKIRNSLRESERSGNAVDLARSELTQPMSRAVDNLAGMTTVLCYHASVAQKSYGKEKRLLCPPPIVRITGPMRELDFKPSLMMTILSSDGTKQKFEKAPLVPSPSPTNYLWAGFKSLYVTSATPTKTISLRLSLHPPPPSLPHQDARLISISEDPILLPPFAAFDSTEIDIISKPSRKTARARNLKSCLLNGSHIAFFSRINSQTVRTRFLGVGEGDQGGLSARSSTWSAFRIDVVDPITLQLVSDPDYVPSALPRAAYGTASPPPVSTEAHSTRVISYGSTVILTDVTSGIKSPALIVRKVEKNKVLLNSGGPVSQLQKLALERPVKRGEGKDRLGLVSGSNSLDHGFGAIVDEPQMESLYLSTSSEGWNEFGEEMDYSALAAASDFEDDRRNSNASTSTESSRKRAKLYNEDDDDDEGVARATKSATVAGLRRSLITYLPPRRVNFASNGDGADGDDIKPTMTMRKKSPTKGKSRGKSKSASKSKSKSFDSQDDDDEEEEELQEEEDREVEVAVPKPIRKSREAGSEELGEVHEIDDVQSWTVIGISSFSYSFFDAYASDKPALPVACITPFPIVLADPVWIPGMGELQLTISNFFYIVQETNQPAPLEVYLGSMGPLNARIIHPRGEYDQAPPNPNDPVADDTGTLLLVTLPSFTEIAASYSASHQNDSTSDPLTLTTNGITLPTPAELLANNIAATAMRTANRMEDNATNGMGSGIRRSSSLGGAAVGSSLANFANFANGSSSSPQYPSHHHSHYSQQEGEQSQEPPIIQSIPLPLIIVRPSDGAAYATGRVIVVDERGWENEQNGWNGGGEGGIEWSIRC